ncbi:hypothetical protein NPIL_521491 [Nephila pilipes]|uniref:Uncharacterized protein n=1 Tax=Nephila pilipes TaxID=299642 RepID=A0A8X6U0W1_NEPPI|nr:hypothetical protein NPIL_521491 [Nephila pilipes]
MYFDSQEESAKKFCLFENQKMGMFPIRKIFPLVELMVEVSLAQSASVKQVKTGGPMLLITRIKSLVVFKFMISFVSTVQSFTVGVSFFLLSLYTAGDMSGLETVEIYRRTPIVYPYSELSFKFSAISSFRECDVSVGIQVGLRFFTLIFSRKF